MCAQRSAIPGSSWERTRSCSWHWASRRRARTGQHGAAQQGTLWSPGPSLYKQRQGCSKRNIRRNGRKGLCRSGFKCSEKVTLSARHGNDGPFYGETVAKAGLQVILVRGVVTLEEDHCICRPGDILNPDQAHLLKLFDHKVAEFRLKICAQWSDGKFQQ